MELITNLVIQDVPLQYFQASGELASHCHGSIEKVGN